MGGVERRMVVRVKMSRRGNIKYWIVVGETEAKVSIKIEQVDQ